MAFRRTRTLLANSVAAVILAACQPSEPVRKTAPHFPAVGDAPALKPVMQHAPLPDFGEISDVKAKKAAFFGFLSPLVEHQNQHLATLRAHLLKLDQAFAEQGGLHPDDLAWLQRLATLLRVESEETATQLRHLKIKVGRIPPALVLAQAANESAWGTSRFAREGNNLFGMWCFRPGCGLAPLQRAAGATHEVAAYKSAEAGLYRYLINLNANPSYVDLRRIRGCLRDQQRNLSGRAMAAGLTGYSERGSHYVKELRAMMRINDLEPWAAEWWGNEDPDNPCFQLVQVVIDEPDPILVAEDNEARDAQPEEGDEQREPTASAAIAAQPGDAAPAEEAAVTASTAPAGESGKVASAAARSVVAE